MIILLSVQNMLKYSGILSTYTDSIWYKLYGYFGVISITILIPSMTTYFLQNTADLFKATSVLIQLSAEWMIFFLTVFFVCKEKQTKFILTELQLKYNKKISEGRGKHFIIADKKANFQANLLAVLIFFAVFLNLSNPLIYTFYKYCTGSLVKGEPWGHPFLGIFPYDAQSTPGYEITYLLNIFYNIVAGFYFIVIANFFLGIILHLVACFFDLRDLLLEVDELFDREIPIQWLSIDEQNKIIEMADKKLKNCVLYHVEILTYIESLSDISSGIIFSLYFGNCVTLSTQTFQLLIRLNSISGLGEFINFFTTASAIFAQLAIFPYFGELLSNHACLMADAVYESCWYKYPPCLRKYAYLIMIRTQKQSYITGLKLVNNSLRSFAALIKLIGSILALFKNVME